MPQQKISPGHECNGDGKIDHLGHVHAVNMVTPQYHRHEVEHFGIGRQVAENIVLKGNDAAHLEILTRQLEVVLQGIVAAPVMRPEDPGRQHRCYQGQDGQGNKHHQQGTMSRRSDGTSSVMLTDPHDRKDAGCGHGDKDCDKEPAVQQASPTQKKCRQG